MKRAYLDDLLAFSQKRYDPAVHDRMVEILRGTKPENLSLRQRFTAAASIQKSIMYLAAEYDFYRPPVNGLGDRVIDENAFPQEMAALLDIAHSISYSGSLQRWLEDRRNVFLDELRHTRAFMQGFYNWDYMPLEDQKDFIRNFIAHSVRVHSLVPPLNPAPSVSIDPDLSGISAYVVKGAPPRAGFSYETFSSDIRDALPVAYHESLHIALQELGRALEDGRIPDTHPLARDALTKLARDSFGDPPKPALDSYYLSDAEERVAYAGQHDFQRRINRFAL